MAASVRTILEALEAIAPRRFAFEFDKVGLQVGEWDSPVSRAVLSLDRSLEAVDYAASREAQLLLSHHPLLFHPLSTVDDRSHVGRTVIRLIRAGIASIAAHTNWDSARGGVNDALTSLLNLKVVHDFGEAANVQRRKLVFFCPEEAVDAVIEAVSQAGAGQIGLYRRCAFMHSGTGTFLGEEGSNPVVGQKGRIEEVSEVRVEMVLRADHETTVMRALRNAHPYEEPAFDFFTLSPDREQSAGRVGDLSSPVSFSQFVASVDQRLNTRSLAWGDPESEIRKVAVVGGAADGEWQAALAAGADVLVTGEVRQHNAVEAVESGFRLVAAGHYATEQPGVIALASRMKKVVTDVEWEIFEPRSGRAGRPFYRE